MAELKALAETLRARLKGRVETDLPLAPLTTYRLGGRAGVFVEPADRADLEFLATTLAERARDAGVLPLGRGSNLLFSDRGFDGIVVRLGGAFAQIDGDDGRVVAGAGVSLPQLTNWAARRGLAGAEFAIAIPGSVGGGVRMNAGAHDSDLSAVLQGVEVMDLGAGGFGRMTPADLGFGYRRSALSDHHVVVSAELALRSADASLVKERVETYRRHRAETQPPAAQNAGSVFKNPPGDHAGRLVEATGLKGFAVGGAEVSRLHANFFIARSGARAQDVFDLIEEVRRRVHDAHGMWLEPEVRFVGAFEGHDE